MKSALFLLVLVIVASATEVAHEKDARDMSDAKYVNPIVYTSVTYGL